MAYQFLYVASGDNGSGKPQVCRNSGGKAADLYERNRLALEVWLDGQENLPGLAQRVTHQLASAGGAPSAR